MDVHDDLFDVSDTMFQILEWFWLRNRAFFSKGSEKVAFSALGDTC
jgi:hypothetical protein